MWGNGPTNLVLLRTMSARVVVQRASSVQKLDFLGMHSAVDAAMPGAIQTKRVLLHTMNAKGNVPLENTVRKLDFTLMSKFKFNLTNYFSLHN